jgi:hypothetical protein
LNDIAITAKNNSGDRTEIVLDENAVMLLIEEIVHKLVAAARGDI